MIHTLKLSNFKSVGEQTYRFTDFDLLVGRNNSGKSTVLQALAIWQFCVDEFQRANRTGDNAIQVVLPNFTALPVPEFNLLWKDRTDRRYPVVGDVKKLKIILIEILVAWRDKNNELQEFGVELRYQSPQSIYAKPVGGWTAFRAYENLPNIAFVPPFSGLEPTEKWLDLMPTRQQVGKGQPGSVLRNLLLRVCPPPTKDANGKVEKGYQVPDDWTELASVVQRWFSVELLPPQYDSAKDVYIGVTYRQNGKIYDLISGGSGFHQTMTLLAFLYGYAPTTILLDEPDAHLHVNLQRDILEYFKQKSIEKGIQFLIATHAEEFIKGVDASQILSLLKQVPTRITSTPEVLRAMSTVSNEDITFLMGAPYIVYVEGESDERLLRAWAPACGAQQVMEKIRFKVMGGGTKPEMRRLASEHFEALKRVVPNVQQLILFDYDGSDQAFHPQADNPALIEWGRKNIENYLLVPPAWQRAALQLLQMTDGDLFAQPCLQTINDFFASENLTLPAGKSWRTLAANIFKVVDGKRLLFENQTALFHTLRGGNPAVGVLRERVAAVMKAEEIHEDVHQFFSKLVGTVNASTLDESA